ncbi:hypothetical protein SBADM41S_01330 [Streptomyces badius]
MTDPLLQLHGDVLAAMRRGPRNFAKLAFALADDKGQADTDQGDFRDRVAAAGAGDGLTALWHRTLTGWDLAEQADWSTSPPRTDARRADAYDRLGFDTTLRKVLDHAVPVFKEPGPTIISTTPTWWYSRDTAAVRSFYWSAYEQLLRRKGWSDAAVAGLDEASHAVVERLADPTRPDAYGARGLVVGYVQSGKTANFTGVTAKAIDAGYRLVIVLGGTLNLLRGQTQRRLDMELIGQENILRGADPADPEALMGVTTRTTRTGRRSSSATGTAPRCSAPSTSSASPPGTTTTRASPPGSALSNSTSRSAPSRCTRRTTSTGPRPA